MVETVPMRTGLIMARGTIVQRMRGRTLSVPTTDARTTTARTTPGPTIRGLTTRSRAIRGQTIHDQTVRGPIVQAAKLHARTQNGLIIRARMRSVLTTRGLKLSGQIIRVRRDLTTTVVRKTSPRRRTPTIDDRKTSRTTTHRAPARIRETRHQRTAMRRAKLQTDRRLNNQ